MLQHWCRILRQLPRLAARGDATQGVAGGAQPIRAGSGGGRASAASPAVSARPAAARHAPSMREIVHIQAGQCGNQIGAKVRPRAPPPRARPRTRRACRVPAGPGTRGRAAGRRRSPRAALAIAKPRTKRRALPAAPTPAFPRPLSPSPGAARARSKSAATLPPHLRPPPAAAGAAGAPAARGAPLGSQLSLKRDGGVGRFGWGSPLKAIMISSALLPPRNRRSSQRPKPPRCPQPRSDNPPLPGPTLFLC